MYSEFVMVQDKTDASPTGPATIILEKKNLAIFGTWDTASLDIEVLVYSDIHGVRVWHKQTVAITADTFLKLDFDIGTVFRVNFTSVGASTSLTVVHGPVDILPLV